MSLETKLITVDVETGVQTTVYTPKYVVGGAIAFSPDGTQIALIDGNNYGQYPERSIYTIDLATNKATQRYSQKSVVNDDGYYDQFQMSELNVWRKDDVLVMSYGPGKGCARYIYSVFDLKTNVLTTNSIPSFDGRSVDGMFVVSLDKSVNPEACSDVMNMCDNAYQAATQFSVFDPISNHKLGTFGDTTMGVSFVAISPDNSAVLYKKSPIPEVEAQCEVYPKPGTFHLKHFDTGIIEDVVDYKSLLADWGITVVDSNTKERYVTREYRNQ